MNRPNSGWKIGSGSVFLFQFSFLQYPASILPYRATSWRSGTQPPWLDRASSFANDSRISACRKESFTLRDLSSKATTRYSICDMHERSGLQTSWACRPHLPIVKHRALCPWLVAISRGVATRTMSRPIYAVSVIKRVHTSIPHSLTCPAYFFASGHSSGVPVALKKNMSQP